MKNQKTIAEKPSFSSGLARVLQSRFPKFLIAGLSLSMLAAISPAQARPSDDKAGHRAKAGAAAKPQKGAAKPVAQAGKSSTKLAAQASSKAAPKNASKAPSKAASNAGTKAADKLAGGKPTGKAAGKRMAAIESPRAKGMSAGKSARAAGAASLKLASARQAGKGGRFLKVAIAPRVIEPARPSIGQAIGLHSVDDPLALRSSVALVADAQTGQVLYEKNGGAVLPIASITKLMTAMVVLDSKAGLREVLEVTEGDRDHERNSRSRLPMGSRLTRLELINLALMASENRAASALGRNHPGGEAAFVQDMNAKARAIGLTDTHFTEGTGLSSANVSTARDLAKMVQAASRYPLIRELSTASELHVDLSGRTVTFRNTNRLVGAESWGVVLQKTGYISEAGQCLVMMANWAERPVIMVFLDSAGRYSRLADAQRVRDWLDARAVQSRVEVKPSQSRAAVQSRAS